MQALITTGCKLRSLLNTTRSIDFVAPLALRVYLAPIFIIAGWGKLKDLESTAYYFAEHLGLPFPDLMALLAGATEFIGGIALLAGIATRWFSIPLMITMLVAAVSAHWSYGWHALPETTLTMPWEWRMDLIEGAQERKQMAAAILKEHGNYDWLTETGSLTILKNGIEFAATYFIMLLVLFFNGAGKLSIDHLVTRKYCASNY
jgi:putative oxidoreductase